MNVSHRKTEDKEIQCQVVYKLENFPPNFKKFSISEESFLASIPNKFQSLSNQRSQLAQIVLSLTRKEQNELKKQQLGEKLHDIKITHLAHRVNLNPTLRYIYI